MLPEGTGVSTQAGYRETLMRSLLARVGLDSTPKYGGSNAPMKPDRSFLYVPIPETDPESGAPLKQRKGMETRYSEIDTGQFGWSLPRKLMGQNTHLSPDFEHLNFCTYDRGGKCIEPLTKGDFVVFFASLVPTEGPKRPLAYVLIGQMFIRDIIAFDEVPKDEYHKYASTRCVPGYYDQRKHHYILRADRKRSGRYSRCSSSFARQDGSIYRVLRDIRRRWGGLWTYTGKDTDAVTRSGGALWSFGRPDEALKWIEEQDTGKLHRSNW